MPTVSCKYSFAVPSTVLGDISEKLAAEMNQPIA
jgi:hypothetical protein